MKMVIQRVSRAEVRVKGEVVGRIGAGLAVLVGLERGDGDCAGCRFWKNFDDGMDEP